MTEMSTSDKARAVWEASNSEMSRFFLFSVISETVGACPFALSTLINPAVCNNRRALPPFVTSLGIATFAPSLISATSFKVLE